MIVLFLVLVEWGLGVGGLRDICGVPADPNPGEFLRSGSEQLHREA